MKLSGNLSMNNRFFNIYNKKYIKKCQDLK